jgi:hypothetical protein
MIRAACHCGAVRFEIAEPPEWVLDCNCTLCRRYGALWSYYHPPDHAKLLMKPDPAATETYLWADRELAFHRCKICGCATHFAVAADGFIFGVNARMMAGLDPAKVRIRRIDNSHSGFFWTRPDEPIIPSRHPVMPPPTFDDWR